MRRFKVQVTHVVRAPYPVVEIDAKSRRQAEDQALAMAFNGALGEKLTAQASDYYTVESCDG